MSPAHYRKEDPKAAKDTMKSMGDAYDLLDLKHQERDKKQNFIDNNLGALSLNDDQPETLYKMYESQKHVNSQLQGFLAQEETFYRSVKKYTDLPQIITGFNDIPKQLADDESFLEMTEGLFV